MLAATADLKLLAAVTNMQIVSVIVVAIPSYVMNFIVMI
jgi:hypothetical protein